MSGKKKIILTASAIFVFVVIFGAGAFWGYYQRPAVEKVVNLFNKEMPKPAEIDFSPFWVSWNTIMSKYADTSKIDNQKMVWGAIQGMVKSLGDPYSTFFPPQESKQFKEEMEGGFEGVGMEIGLKNGVITVVAPLKGTPAFRAGIKSGDRILKIDGKETTDMMPEQAAGLIRGKGGTSVKLTILSKNAEKSKDVVLIREVIQIPVLDAERKANGIFVIKLYNFSANSSNLFRDSLRDFVSSGDSKLILDLRGNPGGYLESAVDIASWFLPVGKVVAREKFSSGEENIFRSRGYDIFDPSKFKVPFIIIVNDGSASASEILAGALQEYGLAKLVGVKTFGKGSVQELVQITSDTSLKLTIARWLTPNGKSISEQGLEPDVKVEISDKDAAAGKDPQMDKAIEMLNK
jgi:carboxyl-terminal processing protease